MHDSKKAPTGSNCLSKLHGPCSTSSTCIFLSLILRWVLLLTLGLIIGIIGSFTLCVIGGTHSFVPAMCYMYRYPKSIHGVYRIQPFRDLASHPVNPIEFTMEPFFFCVSPFSVGVYELQDMNMDIVQSVCLPG